MHVPFPYFFAIMCRRPFGSIRIHSTTTLFAPQLSSRHIVHAFATNDHKRIQVKQLVMLSEDAKVRDASAHVGRSRQEGEIEGLQAANGYRHTPGGPRTSFLDEPLSTEITVFHSKPAPVAGPSPSPTMSRILNNDRPSIVEDEVPRPTLTNHTYFNRMIEVPSKLTVIDKNHDDARHTH